MITDKKQALEQIKKRFDYFINSIQKFIYSGEPLDKGSICKTIKISKELNEDKFIVDFARELFNLETHVIQGLIKMKIEQLEITRPDLEIPEWVSEAKLLDILEYVYSV